MDNKQPTTEALVQGNENRFRLKKKPMYVVIC